MSKEHFNQNGNYYPPDWIKEQLSNYLFKFFNDTCDYINNKRRIEIAEWQLGIHNPYSEIAYVDLEGNPVYKEWSLLNTRRNLQNALLRPGKSNMVAARIEREIKKIKE